MENERLDLPQGTLDLLIRKAVAWNLFMVGPFLNGSSRFLTTLCRCNKAPCIPRSIAWNVEDGSRPNGQSARTTGVQSITN